MQEHTLALEPLSHGFSRLRARQSTTLLALMGLLSLILLLTAANVANLMLVRASRRRRETAVRVALGATTSRIVGYVLVEAVLLASLGGAAGVLAAGWSRHVLAKQLTGTSSILPDGFSLDLRTVMFAIFGSSAHRDRLRRGTRAPRGTRWQSRFGRPQRADERARARFEACGRSSFFNSRCPW